MFPIFLILLGISTPLFAGETAYDTRADVQAVHELANQGKLDEAISRLQEILKKSSPELDSIRLQYDLANLLFLQGRYREARAAYHRVSLMGDDYQGIVTRSKERINKLVEREAKKKDTLILQLIDVETALDAGQFPTDGSKDFLKKVVADPNQIAHHARAEGLLKQIQMMEDEKARQRLDEARQLFDDKKDYRAVLNLLEEIQRDFPDSEEMPSVEILLKETKKKLGNS